MAVEVFGLPALQTNYIWILRDHALARTTVVDPSEAEVVREFLESKNWKLNEILITHHHPDHVGGNLELVAAYDCPVFGWKHDAYRIPAITNRMEEDVFNLSENLTCEVIFIPGHTLGQIAYYFQSEAMVFAGDTLFGMGCGRLFEGSAQQLFESLLRLSQLPDDTQMYCGHEYTQTNGEFAKRFLGHRPEFVRRLKRVKDAREKGRPTVPFTIAEEKQTNPFLNLNDPCLRRALKMEDATETEVFAKLRKLKDQF